MLGAQASAAEELRALAPICHQLPLRAGVFIHTPETWKRARKAVFFPTQLTVPRIKTIAARERSSLPLHAHVTETSCALLILAGSGFGQTLMITFLASQDFLLVPICGARILGCQLCKFAEKQNCTNN